MKREKQTLFVLVSVLMALTFNVCVTAATVVVSDKATYVYGYPAYQSFNYGAKADFDVTENADTPQYGLVQWDFSGYSLAPGETISATIRVKHSWGDIGSFSGGLYQIAASWIEGTDNSSVSTGGVSWNTMPLSYFVGGVDAYVGGWHNISDEGLNLLVEAWIRGTVPNNGVYLRHTQYSNLFEGLDSDDDSNALNRPQLVFTILPPTPGKKVVFSDKVTFVYSWFSRMNFGARTDMQVSENPSTTRYGLVQWDLSGCSIPSGSSVFDAKIRLKHFSLDVGSFSGGVSKITGPWTEGVGILTGDEGGVNATDGSVTWKIKPTVVALGALTTVYDPNSKWHEISGPALNAVIKGWIQGTVTNYGVQLRHMPTSNLQEAFYSDDGSFFGNRPQLIFSIRPPQCGDPGFEKPVYDLNGDCKVNFVDFAPIAQNWLKCTDPNQPCNYVP